jgi:hypothetical protein
LSNEELSDEELSGEELSSEELSGNLVYKDLIFLKHKKNKMVVEIQDGSQNNMKIVVS